MRKLFIVNGWLLMAAVLGGCGVEVSSDASESPEKTKEPLAAVTGTVYWPNGIVPLCWESSMTSHPQYGFMTNRIMELLVDHYPQAANIHFEDAGPCPANSTGVSHVNEICPTGVCSFPNNASSGYHTNGGGHPYVSLNAPEIVANNTRTQQIVLHEFAHELGFVHEHLRGDFSSSCKPEGTWGGLTTYGGPDWDSITASTYCQNNTILSTGDVTALSRSDVYGTPGAFRLLAFTTDTSADIQTNYWTGASWAWAELSTTDITGRSSALTTRMGDRNQIHVFSRTATSDLLVTWYNGFGWNNQLWTDRDISSAPSAISYRDYGKGPNGSFAESPVKFHVYAVSTSGSVLDRYWDGSSWSWIDRGTGGTALKDVSALSFRDFGNTEESIYVFARRTDNKLQLLAGLGSADAWTANLSGPNGASIGEHTALSYRVGTQRQIYLWTTSGGNLWTYRWNGTGWAWSSHGKPSSSVTVSGALTANTWTVNGVRWQSIYGVGSDGSLYEREWNGSSWRWINHGRPSGVPSLSAQSSTVYRTRGTLNAGTVTPINISRHVFIRGSNQKLYVRFTHNNGQTWGWADQSTSTGGPAINASGAAAITDWSR